MRLIPEKSPYVTGNYWCSWCSQSTMLEPGMWEDIPVTDRMRANLNEKLLFDPEKGLLTAYDFCGCRSDLIALLDDGWDVSPCDDKNKFGSLILNSEHFSQFAVEGNPAESLKNLNEYVRELGFRGLGIWIAPQVARESDKVPDVDFATAREYWAERARWSAYAGILYWKVDWGVHCGDYEYRAMMTEVCHQYAPNLLVEHAWVRMPTDLAPEKRAADKDYQYGLKYVCEVLPCSDAFRTYDISEPFRYVSTLSRLAEMFQCVEKSTPRYSARGIFNAEFMAPISIGLGGAVGIMGHEAGRAKCLATSKRTICNLGIDESFRALRWNRIAPPFSLFESENRVSQETLTDGMMFDQKDWPWLKGLVEQTAPARMSRNCPLPEVKSTRPDGLVPFAVSCRYPNGAFAVSTLSRTLDGDRQNTNIPADVTATGASLVQPVAVCGVYHTLTIQFDGEIGNRRVYAQDLLADEATDCTSEVTVCGDRLILSGEWIERVGLSDKSHPEDVSAPGLMLKLI